MKELPKLFQLTKNEFRKAKTVFLNHRVKIIKHDIVNENDGRTTVNEEKYYEPQDVAEYLYIINDMLEYCLKEKENAINLVKETFDKSHVSTVYLTDYEKKVFIDKETKEITFEELTDKDKKRIMKNSNIEYFKSKNQ